MSETEMTWVLPGSWGVAELGDIATIQTGNTPPTADSANYGQKMPFVKPPEVLDAPVVDAPNRLSAQGMQKARIAQPGTILITAIGVLGRTAIARVPVAFNQQIHATTFPDQIEDMFGFYYLQSPWAQREIEARSSATILPIVNKSRFGSLPFPLPPLNEQRRIVEKIEALFSQLDAGVAALERAKTLLERYRQSVLKAAFEGQLTAAWRAEHAGQVEPAEVLLEKINAEREQREQADAKQGKRRRRRKAKASSKAGPPPLDVSELPALPEGWCWARLGELGILDRGKSRHRPRNAPHLYGGPYPFVQTGDVKSSNGVLTEYTQTYSEAGLEQSRLWPEGTLCITIAANIARTAILGIEACFPDSIVGFLPSGALGDAVYVELFFRTARYEIERYAPATAQKNINLAILRDVAVPLASITEQRQIVELLETLLSAMSRADIDIEQELARAARLRQAILKRAFEGHLVPQDPDDEPASVLLERIRGQRQGRSS